ncbi:hypothetical protein F8271_21835 [Micromonospora sp. ALFpr18c]|uniref:hypothetical protein n=1 Tax=unclassified Micromonospora TaxID=2617518 RepID=UPI00124B898C|nr:MULTISPECIES: hypothetical protein [unclassified Micromonospora]KAB1935319.1 hypothetical protein F8271_21835 [Micromonospora sp. ALFpr18c]MDG4756992.1 hypothetical protein [Micromonospora sp. WMMD710]
MGDDEPAAGALPYAEVTDEAYAARAAAGFAVREFEFAVQLSGRCPRCDHSMTSTLVDGLYRRDASVVASDPDYRTVLCECEADHPARPLGLRGCGAHWTLRLEVEA